MFSLSSKNVTSQFKWPSFWEDKWTCSCLLPPNKSKVSPFVCLDAHNLSGYWQGREQLAPGDPRSCSIPPQQSCSAPRRQPARSGWCAGLGWARRDAGIWSIQYSAHHSPPVQCAHAELLWQCSIIYMLYYSVEPDWKSCGSKSCLICHFSTKSHFLRDTLYMSCIMYVYEYRSP